MTVLDVLANTVIYDRARFFGTALSKVTMHDCYF